MNSIEALRELAQVPALDETGMRGFVQRGLVPGQFLTLQVFPPNSPVLDVGYYEAREAMVRYLPNPYTQDEGVPAVMRESRAFTFKAELEEHLSTLVAAFERWDGQRQW